MEKKKECRYRSNGVINEGAGSRKTNAKGKHEQKMYRCMVNSAERGGGGETDRHKHLPLLSTGYW
jgi:hypothetical protein